MDLTKSDVLYMYLADSTFVDLMEIMTPDQLKQFILIYGGTTLSVPSMADIKNCNRDFRIYSYVEGQIKNKSKKSLHDIYSDTAKVFFCAETAVYKIHTNIKQYHERLKEQQDKIKI